MSEAKTISQNPLYEKMYHRFSYNGKTVGEMMLARAHAAGGSSRESIVGSDITSEMRITHANFLPSSEISAPALARPTRPFFTLRKINPSAALALVLALLIMAYLLFAGISHSNTPKNHLRTASAAEVTADTVEALPYS